MGCAHHIACLTCKEDTYFWYGSCGGFLGSDQKKEYEDNHQGHDLFFWDEDSWNEEGGHLVYYGAASSCHGEIDIKDFKDFVRRKYDKRHES